MGGYPSDRKRRVSGLRCEWSKSALKSADTTCRVFYIITTDQPISETLRRAINKSGPTFLALEREAGVIRQSLMTFARGEASISLAAVEKLAIYFGLEL